MKGVATTSIWTFTPVCTNHILHILREVGLVGEKVTIQDPPTLMEVAWKRERGRGALGSVSEELPQEQASTQNLRLSFALSKFGLNCGGAKDRLKFQSFMRFDEIASISLSLSLTL